MTVALVTAANSRALDEDLPLLGAALDDLGVANAVVDWDDPAADWASFALAVVRSPWDYPERRDEFLAWADAAGAATTLLNPPDVLRWNTDKRYLAELARDGVPIVPTTFFEPDDGVVLPVAGDCVVKPAISAGRGTRRATPPTRRLPRPNTSPASRPPGASRWCSPTSTQIDALGETALVFVDGAFSHGLRKAPILAGTVEMVDGGLYALETMEQRDPTPAEHDVATATLAAAAAALATTNPLLYARVDLVPGEDGQPLLLELEVTEPSLFHTYAPGSAARFAAAIAARLTPR